jgi:UDP-2,3-diacylglucosamine hydrolase
LHVGAPKTFEAWRAHLQQTPADAVLMLGDLFEVWVGDDSRHAGFERDCADVISEAARRKTLCFMPGNRDFLLGETMRTAVGLQSLADPTLARAWGQRVLLTHGDALCVADIPYQRFRQEVRSTAWQRAFLALPLPERQQRARAMRDASQAHQSNLPMGEWADVDEALAAEWLDSARARTMVHGHTHRPASHDLGSGRVRHVLGDWDFDAPASRARLLVWTAEGLSAVDLAKP